MPRKLHLLLALCAGASLALVIPASSVFGGTTTQGQVFCAGQSATQIVPGNVGFGTDQDDVIVVTGEAGATVHARAGDDLICGSPFNDSLQGGSDKDEIYGDFGDDEIYGRSGTDYLDGGGPAIKAKRGGRSGDDLCHGGRPKPIGANGKDPDEANKGTCDHIRQAKGIVID